MKYFDGYLYFTIAVCGAVAASLQTDEAMNYIQPSTLFWLRVAVTSIGAGALALKTWRSTGYADSRATRSETLTQTTTETKVPETKP